MKASIKNQTILGVSIALLIALNSCSRDIKSARSLKTIMREVPSIKGNPEYIKSPYVTAGDRLYMIGFQDGTFPEMGFHTPGEMGGIWDHPIKLMDGFDVELKEKSSGKTAHLDKADTFSNYPFANEHVYHLKELNIDITRFQFVPDSIQGIIVEFEVTNNNEAKQDLEFTFNGAVDLLPAWLAERNNIKDGHDLLSYDERINAIVAKDSLNDWYVAFGSTLPLTSDLKSKNKIKRKDNGIIGSFTINLSIAPGQTEIIPVYIAGSYQSKDESIKTLHTLQSSAEKFLDSKKVRYKKIEETARVTLPDKKIQEMYTWTKYTTDWLRRDVPGTGNGLGAGLPDYPWWFGCDNEYSIQGILCNGQPEWVKSTLLTLQQLSEKTNGNGRIIHEASTNGVVYNPGNMNETPQFANAAWEYYRWTGDKETLKKLYPTIKKGLNWLLTEHDDDKNLSPEGPGMVEIQGLDSEMIDVAVYTQLGLAAAANIARELGEGADQKEYSEKAKQLKKSINSDWWVEEASSFADFRSTTEKALSLLDAAVVRADTLKKPWAVKELKDARKKMEKYPKNQIRPFVVHHNSVVNSPMETGVADPGKAIRALETAKRYSNKFGMYVTGIDRIEKDVTSEKWKSFSYVGAVMTIATGVQAIAESNYGRPEESLRYLEKLSNSFSYALPGSLYEVSPDYGMFVQEWSVYGIARPIVYYFFGVQPEAYAKQIRIAPRMPTGWDDAMLENLPVGDNVISIKKTTNSGEVTYVIDQTKDDWKIIFNVVNPGAREILVNETLMKMDLKGKEIEFSISGKKNIIRIKN
jgi:glycogen debranching enzyme